MKLAIIRNNKIAYIWDSDEEWEGPAEFTAIPFEQAEGMEYEETTRHFYPITPRQLRLWLLSKNKLADVQYAVSQLPEPTKTAAEIEWAYASVFLRHHPMVIQIGAAVGLSEEELNEAFTLSPFLFP